MTSLMQGFVQLSAHPLVHALGWTLLHFCWQGIAVALVLWCVLGMLGGQSSQARYAAACLAMALMVALPAATFTHVASAEYKARTAMLGSGIVLDAGMVLQVGMTEPVPPWPARIGAALDHAVPWVLLAWFAGVIVFVGRLNFGLLVARKLKTAGTDAPSPALLQLFEELRVRLGVDRAVELLHSAQVQVPTVIGWLRPVVLLPVTCLTGLPPEQIEAVLCHELAHVRRHDYLVSVVQSVIETVLFYHPAVWWVSKQVRRERECCCDELAVGVGGNVLAYARALSYLEESRASFPEFVLGANGGVLKMRIKRLLKGKPDVAGSPAAALVALAMILAVAGSYFVGVSRAQTQAAREIASAAEPVASVSVSQEGTAEKANHERTMALVYRSWLTEDVRWIITDPEAQAFLQLANDEERDKFIDQFWARHNPPGSPDGSFKQEHYARIAYSNQQFGVDGEPGWKTDRGHIYIVYGKPESIDSHSNGGVSFAYPYEVWHYKYIAGIGDNVDLSFVDTCKCGQYNLTIDRPGLPTAGPGADNMQARAILASRILAPGGASTPQSATPSQYQYLMPAIQNAPAVPTGISGTIVDSHGAPVPGAKVTAINTDTGAKLSLYTDSSKVYGFLALPPGPYNLEVEAKGFQRLFQENIRVKPGQMVDLNLKLSAGAATENFIVTGKPVAEAPPALPAMTGKPTALPQHISAGVMQGNLISKVDPAYPTDAKAQHIQGVVVLHARISKDGTIKDVQVVSGPPALIVSAIDAVRQWKYKPYLVDGDPTEVETTININYTFGGDAEPSVQPGAAAAPATSQASGGRRFVPVRFATRLVISASNPAYPPIAKAAHVQGDVILAAVLSKAGEVEDVKTISGAPMLVGSAIDAVKQWKYNPPDQTHSDPAPMIATFIVHFALGDAASPSTMGSGSTQAPTILVTAAQPDKTAEAKSEQEYRDMLSTANGVRKIGGNVSSPILIYKVDPEFSAEARQAKIGGEVLVNMIVSPQGIPVNVHVLRGIGHGLDEQAVMAVKQYRFKPATEDGKPVPVELNVLVNFKVMDTPEPDGTEGNPSQPPANGSAPLAQTAPLQFNAVPVRTVGGGVSQPQVIYKVDPTFTVEARKAKFQGVVLVNLIVDATGRPRNVHVVRGVGMGLDEKAVQALKQYKFKPALEGGNPVPVGLNVEVNFRVF